MGLLDERSLATRSDAEAGGGGGVRGGDEARLPRVVGQGDQHEEETGGGLALVNEPALQLMRQDLCINADGQVRVVFEGDERVPVFECFPCDELLHWEDEARWWQCPNCSYELTTAEAEELLCLALRRLELRLTDIRRKQGKGRWGEFFSRLGRAFSSLLS